MTIYVVNTAVDETNKLESGHQLLGGGGGEGRYYFKG